MSAARGAHLTECSVFDMETLTGTFADGTVTFTTADADTLEVEPRHPSMPIAPGPRTASPARA